MFIYLFIYLTVFSVFYMVTLIINNILMLSPLDWIYSPMTGYIQQCWQRLILFIYL